MKGSLGKIILALFAILPKPAFAENDTPLDISFVVSVDSWKETEYRPDVSPYYRYRAIYHKSLWDEGNPWLEVQKIHTGGGPIKLLWSKKIDAGSNEATSKALDEICGKNAPAELDCESKIGCCRMDGIRWDKLALSYRIYINQSGSRRVRTFQCKGNRLPYDDFTIHCAEETQ